MMLPPLSDPYVPGQTARPPEALFDALRQSVPRQMEPGELTGSDAWGAGWALFERGYFWEAHEVWEPIWLALPPNSGARHAVQAAIQLANAALKLRMGRVAAARRLCALAREAAGRTNGANAPDDSLALFHACLTEVEKRFESMHYSA